MSLILSGTDGLSDVDGSAATPAIRGTDANTGIFFPAADTIAFAEGGVESMRIDSSGNVGIGTSSPSAPMDVVSNSSAIGTRIRGRSADSYGVLEFTNNSASTETARIAADTSGNIIFSNTGSVTERMRIDSSGIFMLGTTIVGGEGGLTILPNFDDGAARIIFDRASTTASSIVQSFRNAGTASGQISYTNTATSYTTSSDYRLKEAVTPMTGALAKVASLKPVTYKWKVDGSDGQGFIAHELQEVVEGCVTGEKDAVDADGNPQYQGVDTSFLVATLTAAIQEQQALIVQLQADVAALKGATA